MMKAILFAMLAAALALSGCANGRLAAAGRDAGRAAAGVVLPAWPDECRRAEPHAALAKGAEALSVLKRERAALDRANGRAAACAGYYDDLSTRLKKEH